MHPSASDQDLLHAGGPTMHTLNAQPRADLVFMDIAMPVLSGLAATEKIKAARAETKVIVLSMHLNEDYIRRALSAGADGYIVKDAAPSELKVAVRAVMAGRNYLSPAAASLLMRQALPGMRQADPLQLLSPRQREVLRLMAEGSSTKEIARVLERSPKTVDIHRAQLMQRLDFHGVAGLTRFAVRVGLVSTE